MTEDQPESMLGPEALSALEDFIRAGAVLVERLKDSHGDQIGDIVADPAAALIGLGRRLGVEWQGSLEELVAYAKARLAGDYAVDQFGFDPEFTERIVLPVIRLLTEKWFRLELRGAENIPATGSALLVANHAGTLPLDALVLHSAVYDAIGRHTRMLGADLVFTTPFSHDLARRIGATVAHPEDAALLLENNSLVSVFPEGFKGLGKRYSERYRLQRFGRGGFVSTAAHSSVPIVPVSIVGSEEIYPMLSNATGLARALGVPYFPITPLFPWLGVLGMIPLPSKWIIEFGEPISTAELPEGAADDPAVVLQLTDQVRITIQNTLYRLLEERPGAFS
jgi:1-acyl-sn-glycerol-3-phosphate acyltransferase